MTNFNDTNTNKNSSGNTKFLSELRGASIIVTIVLISLLALSVGLYAYMQKTPPKHVIIDDQMDLFTSSELDEIEELANELSEERNQNVAVVVTDDKGWEYSDDDDGYQAYVDDYYSENFIDTPFQDNSGFIIFLDLTNMDVGGKYFYIYTYGTAFYSASDAEVTDIFEQHKPELRQGKYSSVVCSVLSELTNKDYDFGSIIISGAIMVIVPLLIVVLFYFFAFKPKKLDAYPDGAVYLNAGKCGKMEATDAFVNRSVTVVHHSSSSSGGGGGGGGAGHSGGGGGHF